ncbi:hypothetical protein DL771_003506 [Monosporascus sp. 5C6A]|nr:hypothetical protein DL771_003506 [Monosporascus sp. 5C6A]
MDQGSGAAKTSKTSAGVATQVVYSKEQVAEFVLDYAASDEEILQVQQKIKNQLPKRDRQTVKCTYDELDQLMTKCLHEAGSKQQSHQTEKTLSKRVGKRAVDFLVGCHDYLQAYSGVVQLMEGVSPGYGTAAYEVLSVFLVVAVNKKQTEDGIDAMLETLRREYARIGRLGPIYANEKMHGSIAEVYSLGIRFLQDAARYYSFKSYRRFWHILAKPPSVDLQSRVSSIEKAIALPTYNPAELAFTGCDWCHSATQNAIAEYESAEPQFKQPRQN